MTWSTPDPRPAEPVLGDPASVSALAAVLRRTAGDIERALAGTTEGGTQSRRHAARLRALRGRGETVTASMERTGHRLAEHAADLADALGLARRLVDRAASLGLRVDGSDVIRPRGVHGLADAATEEIRTEALARLQRVLDTVLIDLDTRRRELRADLTSEQGRRASR
jgi:transcription initiation factor TFIIIB Brf1 subunit/transcription initiation factor TFIIB